MITPITGRTKAQRRQTLKRTKRFFLLSLSVLALTASARAEVPTPKPGLEKIDHFVVIFMENRSFDNIFGTFPGANGIANAGDAAIQVDAAGKPLETLPPVIDSHHRPPARDTRFPENLPNKPFLTETYVPVDQNTPDLVHRFYTQQAQINGGKMNRFAAMSDAGALAMSYYDGSKLPLWSYAQRYTLADNFFHAAFGGSFLNHFWLVCACTPKFPGASERLIAKNVREENGKLLGDLAVTTDFYAVNTLQPAQGPFQPDADKERLLPPQEDVTIGDRLIAKNISWAWYSGGWDAAESGNAPKLFQYHHQPFAAFKTFARGTEARKKHLRDGAEFMEAIDKGTLPQVTFYKPVGEDNFHPGYTNLLRGQQHVADILAKIEKSPQWGKTLVIVTTDENGGLWDHVAPPKIDRWGPGTRIPALFISPFAKKGFIDKTQYDTTSILKTLETRFGLEPLASRDAGANDLTNALDLK